MAGRVIALNGTSSAGKSTLAAALQRRLIVDGDCWIVMATDDLFVKLPRAFLEIGAHRGEHAELGVVFGEHDGEMTMRMGPVGRALLEANKAAVRAVAGAGINVIVDEVILAEQEWDGWRAALDGLDAWWVRVELELDLVEQRERDRGDRQVGMARSQIDVVHRYPTYDMQVDTGLLDPEAAAEAVHTCWLTRTR